MWFGTKYGLNRFDGHEFKSYQHQKNIPGTIGNNFIRKIFKYDAKTFWIGTDEGIYIFDLETEKFKIFNPLGKIFINDIIRAANGDIWIASKEKGVFRYDPKSHQLINFSYSPNSKNRISSNEISKLLQDDSGHIWVGTYGKGIDVIDPNTGRIKTYKASGASGSLSSNVILDLFKDLSGNIWVGTMAGGLNAWNKQTNTFKVFIKAGKNTISDNIVRSIYQPKTGILYLATEKGLNVYDIEKDQFTAYQNENNDPFSISDDAVYTIFKDKEGGIWSGTYFGGLNYFHEKGSDFEYYYPSGVNNSLSGNAVSAFLETGSGNFWIGTEDGGLNYFNTTDKTFKKFPFKTGQDSLSYHNIHALYKDNKSNIWVGMYTGGLNILDPLTGKIRRYKSDPADINTLSDNSVYSIDEDKQGRIWVSTISGLNLYNPANDGFIRIKGKSLEKSCIYQTFQDEDGIIWIASYDHGLIRMDKKMNLKQYSVSGKSGSISSNKVISITDDENGNLWLGTDGGGLNVFNKKTARFRVYDERHGLKSDVIYGVIKDQEDLFWLSTNNGIYEFDPNGNPLFKKRDNLQSQQYNYKSVYKSFAGKLYFGSINGFNSFYPKQVEIDNSPKSVSFTNFQLFNKDLEVGDKESPLKKTVSYSSHITLQHDQSVMSFEYAALSFIAPDKVQYAFKMEGFDKDWNDVGAQRKATYTNLPAGDYTFQVKEAGQQGSANKQISSIRITILPPFYKTAFAYLVYFGVLIALVLLLKKYALRKALKRNEIKLERLKTKSEQDFYKQKIEFFTAMAHEVRTPLSLIIAPLERLLSKRWKDPESKRQLMIMEENSDRLLTLVNQLLDFRRIESDIFEIHTETIELVSFVNNLKERFSSISYQKGLEFTVVSSLKKLDVEADPEALLKILSNLLINAFKFTRGHVKISINDLQTVEDGGQMVSISVEDDGIGIPASQIDSIFNKFFKVSTDDHHYSNLGGTGIGLALAKSLTEKHCGKLIVESEQGVKTVFTILIPFKENKNSHLKIFPADDDVLNAENLDGKQTILVVEDDPALLDFIFKSLISDGYCALKASNGADALQQLEEHQADLVISDIMMPVMDGLELCKKVKNDLNYSHLPFILLTARTNSESEIEGLKCGADAYIAKPFKWKQLSLVIKNLIDLQHKLKQRYAQQPFESTEILHSNSRDKKFMSKLVESIEERISDPQLSVEELGREVGLSRSSLYKKVKAITGHVPNEFIRLIRLKKAARLLTMQEYNISEIGYMVGFSSHSYFSKCFFQQFKKTPTEFAEDHKHNEILETP